LTGDILNQNSFTLNRLTLAEQVAEKIEMMILSDDPKLAGKLPSEQALAVSFSVSRTVIREALVILRAKGLIVKSNGVSSQIRKQPAINLENTFKWIIHLQNVNPQEIYEVRVALEAMAIYLAAEKHTEEDLACLEELVREMEQNNHDLEARTKADLKFHQKIVSMSGNSLLIPISDSLFTLLHDIVYGTLKKIGPSEDSTVMHNRIIEAIRNGDPDTAVEQMRIHLALFIRNCSIK
jgi:GntR family transcriptional repressor for pyruvate dehydrogenase complex